MFIGTFWLDFRRTQSLFSLLHVHLSYYNFNDLHVMKDFCATLPNGKKDRSITDLLFIKMSEMFSYTNLLSQAELIVKNCINV
jgi:hypothetical protein